MKRDSLDLKYEKKVMNQDLYVLSVLADLSQCFVLL